MYKLPAMAAVIIAASLMGIVMSGELKKRIDTLKEIVQSALYIKTDLEYRAPNLEECFTRRGCMFNSAGKFMSQSGMTPFEAVKRACEDERYLTKEDKDTILIFAENLNCEEISGQVANIKWLVENLRKNIRNAEDEYRSKGKLYQLGGMFAGVGIVIILL